MPEIKLPTYEQVESIKKVSGYLVDEHERRYTAVLENTITLTKGFNVNGNREGNQCLLDSDGEYFYIWTTATTLDKINVNSGISVNRLPGIQTLAPDGFSMGMQQDENYIYVLYQITSSQAGIHKIKKSDFTIEISMQFASTGTLFITRFKLLLLGNYLYYYTQTGTSASKVFKIDKNTLTFSEIYFLPEGVVPLGFVTDGMFLYLHQMGLNNSVTFHKILKLNFNGELIAESAVFGNRYSNNSGLYINENYLIALDGGYGDVHILNKSTLQIVNVSSAEGNVVFVSDRLIIRSRKQFNELNFIVVNDFGNDDFSNKTTYKLGKNEEISSFVNNANADGLPIYAIGTDTRRTNTISGIFEFYAGASIAGYKEVNI